MRVSSDILDNNAAFYILACLGDVSSSLPRAKRGPGRSLRLFCALAPPFCSFSAYSSVSVLSCPSYALFWLSHPTVAVVFCCDLRCPAPAACTSLARNSALSSSLHIPGRFFASQPHAVATLRIPSVLLRLNAFPWL